MDEQTAEQAGAARLIYRHRLATRLWHWTNALAVILLWMSGMMILNAHPHLYWGEYGANFDTPWFSVSMVFDDGRVPGWLTIPSFYSLAAARRWHLFFALILGFGLLVFMIASLINRHFRRDLTLRREDVSPRHLGRDIAAHARLRFHDPARPAAYNSLQKWSYILVIFIALPLIIVTGLAMSPGMNAAMPWLTDLFGGRQTARSVHFLVAIGLAIFFAVHLLLVLLAGPINELRSIITGWWRTPAPEPQEPRP